MERDKIFFFGMIHFLLRDFSHLCDVFNYIYVDTWNTFFINSVFHLALVIKIKDIHLFTKFNNNSILKVAWSLNENFFCLVIHLLALLRSLLLYWKMFWKTCIVLLFLVFLFDTYLSYFFKNRNNSKNGNCSYQPIIL